MKFFLGCLTNVQITALDRDGRDVVMAVKTQLTPSENSIKNNKCSHKGKNNNTEQEKVGEKA